MEQYIVDLFTGSRNNLVSNLNVFADMVIRYNSGQKISLLCLPSTIKWTNDQIKVYIDVSLPNWTKNDREKFATLFKNAESLGPVWIALQHINVDSLCRYEDLDESLLSLIHVTLNTSAKSWVGFDIVERELLGGGGSVGCFVDSAAIN
jgi:hypothetical protein